LFAKLLLLLHTPAGMRAGRPSLLLLLLLLLLVLLLLCVQRCNEGTC
jgi:hypothetical protein